MSAQVIDLAEERCARSPHAVVVTAAGPWVIPVHVVLDWVQGKSVPPSPILERIIAEWWALVCDREEVTHGAH